MSVKYALLVLLEKEPASGYDLAQRFNLGIGQFWQCSHQQIYQELKKAHAQNLLSFAHEAQQGRPDRKVYSVTEQGREALSQWLSAQDKPPTVRDALLIKIYAAARADHSALLVEIARHIELHQAQLDVHREQEARYFAADEAGRRKLRWPYLTLRRGIRYEQEWLCWLEEVRTCLLEDSLPQAPVQHRNTTTQLPT